MVLIYKCVAKFFLINSDFFAGFRLPNLKYSLCFVPTSEEIMNRRSSMQLRPRNKEIPKTKRKCKSLSTGRRSIDEQRKYDRDRKRQWRAETGDATVKRRGPKVKIDIKNMSPEERRQYYREKRQNSRSRRSQTVDDSDIHFETEQ